MSQAAFARMVGIGESTLSRWLAGDYPGNAEKVEKKILSFFERDKVREKVKDKRDIVFAETGISRTIMNTLDYCRVQKQIVCIYGDAGCGKTFTSNYWRKDKPDVYMITASPAISSAKAILKTLARTFNSRTNCNKDDLYFDLLDKLDGKDITLIIDEAQHLNHASLEMIRSVQEAVGIGLALIGNAVIYNRLVGKQEAEFAQLFSRLMMRQHILTDQFTQADVLKVFGAVEDAELEYLLQICKSRYGLRGASFVYMNAINNGNTKKSGLMAMAKSMGILL